MLLSVEGADPDRRDKLIELLDIDLQWRMHKVSDGQRRRVQICLGLLHPYKVSFKSPESREFVVYGCYAVVYGYLLYRGDLFRKKIIILNSDNALMSFAILFIFYVWQRVNSNRIYNWNP